MTLNTTDYVRLFREKWRALVIVTVIFVAAAALVTLLQPKVYAASASAFVSNGTNTDASLAEASDNVAKSRAKSYIALATSRATANTVIHDLGLRADPAQLVKSITVEQPLDTVLLNVTAQGSTPAAARQLADAWIAALSREVASLEDPQGIGNAVTLRLVPVEAAELPSVPVSPRAELNLALGLALGLVAGMVFVLSRNRFDRRLRYVSTVEEVAAVPVIGSIPEAPCLTRAPGRAGPPARHPRASATLDRAAGEQLRKLRTNLQFMDSTFAPQVVVVSAPLDGDGASTIAAHLAATVAATGRSVVLVDANLRNPRQAALFGLDNGPGLTDALLRSTNPREIVQGVDGRPGLQVLVAGGTCTSPSELLGSPAMHALIRDLAEGATVIVDGPPVLPVTDSVVLTAAADGVVLVVTRGRTLDSDLEDAMMQLEAGKCRTLGIVFNRAQSPRRQRGRRGQASVASDPDAGPRHRQKPLVAEDELLAADQARPPA